MVGQLGRFPQPHDDHPAGRGTWYERRDRALLAHATQIDPDGWFFKVPLDVQRQIWPHEDFRPPLGRAIVPGEDDLFAGLPSVAEADVWATSRSRVRRRQCQGASVMNDGGVGPGMGAFTVFFIPAIVLWLLMRNMNARLRRMDYAHKQEDAQTARSADTLGRGDPAARRSRRQVVRPRRRTRPTTPRRNG